MEETFIDKNYIDKNGDGYNMAKVRLRTTRKPVIGDKFCSLPTQQVLTNMGWVRISDIDTTIHKCATLDHNNNLIYEYPTAKYEYPHNGDMYHIHTDDVRVTCTMNHKLYVNIIENSFIDDDFFDLFDYFESTPTHSDDIIFKLTEASQVVGKPIQFQQSVNNNFKNSLGYYLNGVNIPLNILLLLNSVYYHIGYSDKRLGTFIFQLQGCPNYNYKTVSGIFHLLKINFTYIESNEQIIIQKCKYPELETIFYSYDENKFPEFIWTLSKSLSIHFLGLLFRSPYKERGNIIQSSPNFVITTHKEEWINDITRLAIHCSYNSKTTVEKYPTVVYYIEIITTNLQPIVNMTEIEDTVIYYTGNVYCIEMSTSHVYISRESTFSPSIVIGNSSRSGQKGTVGAIIPEADMPYTESGIRPDIIINPHAIPSRMTMAQLKETLLCKVLVMLGLFGDGTSYGDMDVSTISDKLLNLGYEKSGDELLYNGITGTQIECNVFVGPVFYQRLKHMVSDKYHSRSTGRMVNFTRQPAEGRSRDGGLRFGEMERDAIISHGASRFIRSRMYDVSDKYQIHVCKQCGMIASYNDKIHIHICHTCGNRTDFSYVEIPYACKLMFQELMTMNIVPRMITE